MCPSERLRKQRTKIVAAKRGETVRPRWPQISAYSVTNAAHQRAVARTHRMLERAKEVTRNGEYTYVEYARFADDLVILVDEYRRHDWLLQAVDKRLRGTLQATSSDQMRRRVKR